MKARVILWDMDGKGKKWIDDNIRTDRLDIVQIIPVYEKNVQLINDDIDLLLIATHEIDLGLEKMLEYVGFHSDRYVYIYHLGSWYEKFSLAMFLLKDEPGTMGRLLLWRREGDLKDYCTCRADGLTFVASVKDCTIMPKMFMDGQTWSADEMKLFYELAHEYYAISDDRPGYFLDLGANIGTTCIYFRRKLDENVKIIAFEPDVRNNRLLHINMQLNCLTEEARIEAYGLSNRSEKKTLHYDESNPGGTSLVKNPGGLTTEVSLISLDDYFAANKLDAGKIKYIWIDTEGFEPLVIGGAQKILRHNDIPLYMEFNPYLWEKQGLFDDMLTILQNSGYTDFIMIQEYMEGNKSVFPLCALQSLRTAGAWYLRDIFLIKN